jgi:beta/gamma crystallin
MRNLPRLGFAVALALAAAPLAAQYEERAIGGIGITVFRDENFRGENATFRSDVPDLRRFGFSDRITSLRVAPGEYWEGCELANYRGRCQVFSGEERDLRRIGWTDKISSFRRVRGGGGGGGGNPGPFPPGGRRGIILYDDPFFRGNSLPLRTASENLRFQSFHDRAESVRVLSGRWELCAEPNFRRCQVVDRDVTHLSTLGLNKKLSSVRPAGFVPGGPGGGGGGGYPVPVPDRGRLVLFERPGYRGQSITLDSASAILPGLPRARSAQVIDGTWQLCDAPRFSGRCMRVNSSVPNFDSFGLNGPIMSARPVRGY